MAKILIVDDTMVARKILRSILQIAGHEIVDEADNGKKGVELYRTCQPDLLIIDINMPIMDGLEATRIICAEHADAKIIVLSANGNKEAVITAFKNGAKHYLLKPVESLMAVEVINRVLNDELNKAYNTSIVSEWNLASGNNNNKTEENKVVKAEQEAIAFSFEKVNDDLIIKLNVKQISTHLEGFYAKFIADFRKYLLMKIHSAIFIFESNESDPQSLNIISEFIGLVSDAAIKVKIDALEEVATKIKVLTDSKKIQCDIVVRMTK